MSHDPKSSRRPERTGIDGVTTTSSDVEPAIVQVERNRLVVAGAMIGLFALLLGFVLGRAGSTDDALAPVSATSDAPDTTLDESLTAIESPASFEDFEPPSTTQQVRRTTTTTPVQTPEAGSIAVNPLLAGREMDVIALKGGGELVIIDVASGETTTYDIGRFNYGSPGSIFAGDGWVLLPDFNGGERSTVVLDDGTRSQIETGPGWNLLMDDGSDVFWRFDADGDSPSIGFETRFDGTPTGVEIDLPAPPISTDPLGGLVVSSGSGAYRVDPTGVQQLTTGQLIALGRRRMVVHECDEVLRCSYFVEERSTGDRRLLDVAGLDRRAQISASGWYPFRTDFDVDETRALVTAWQNFGDGRPIPGILDLDTGEFVEIDPNSVFAVMQWSVDGQFVFMLGGSTLEILDPATGEATPFSDELGNVVAFAIRPNG